ncbi:hypothetical protein CKAH01_16376 [Colletotrichum kahawae]|uniref:Uncharacterized protein n=1 Tax=Colletotrichum kahawae TaxID=34407 RepID=A0AAD9YG06_COLKA|nr:hypothetical protein CKAH01_16376 [Colletotrichum kahawae]
MIARISTVAPVALTALSLGAQAATVNDGSPAASNPLEARAGLCCAHAQDNRIIQTICQYMHESCGGWDNCVSGNDNQWCRHCIVNHPEDPACLKLTWPPVDPAPVGKRDEIDANISPPERSIPADKSEPPLRRRAPESAIITTKYTPNVAQSFFKTFGLVTIRIIVSAVNVVTYSIQNAGAEEVVWTIADQATQWIKTGTVASGATDGGAAPNQVVAKGGDSFKVIVSR